MSGVRRKGRVSLDVTGPKTLHLSQETRQQAVLACLTAGQRSGRDEEGEGERNEGKKTDCWRSATHSRFI